MDSTQTLHDFVLNLLTDPEARSAFQLDPEGALQDAGLSDITAADVEDVVPLVVDYASVQGNAGAVADLDLAAVSADPTSAIGQLQAVTDQLAGSVQPTSVDGNVAAAGAIAVDTSGLGVAADGWAGVGLSAGPSGVSADLSTTQDVAGTLDSDVVEAVTAEPTGVVDDTLGTTEGVLGGGPADGLLGPGDGLLSPADGLLGGATGDALGVADGVLGTTEGVLGGTDGVLGGADGALGGTEGVLGTTEGVLGGADGVVGTAGSTVNGLTSGDPTGAVDSVVDGGTPVTAPDGGGSVVDQTTGTVGGVLDDATGGLLSGDAGANSETEAHGSADSGLGDILF